VTGPPGQAGRIVLLAGPGEPTAIVFHYLAARFDDVVLVEEESVPRPTLAKRRARRLGWPTVVGQVAFVTVALPVLRWRSRRRAAALLARSDLRTDPVTPAHRVTSVNAPETIELLASLEPAVVVINGTRIIADAVLRSLTVPVLNIHAGITPRYRGVHGGYWALAEGRPDLAGTTVHLVDAGIDTGGVLDRAYFGPEPGDNFATYPYRHLADGLPLLAEQVGRVLGGGTLVEAGPGPDGAEESQLRWHPTLWGYLWRRLRRGVR
jgi:folate-dependent phosphoribosylglycinamide formyltransferase PurN